VDDCGNGINPVLVDGQIHGGIVQALGQAMFEEAVYDEQGQLITGELTDYAIPRAGDMPWIETDRTVTPTPVNPLGVKGVGEAGTIGGTPCFANAVVDALTPFGVRHIDMPFKRERIWRLMHDGKLTHNGKRQSPQSPAGSAKRIASKPSKPTRPAKAKPAGKKSAKSRRAK